MSRWNDARDWKSGEPIGRRAWIESLDEAVRELVHVQALEQSRLLRAAVALALWSAELEYATRAAGSTRESGPFARPASDAGPLHSRDFRASGSRIEGAEPLAHALRSPRLDRSASTGGDSDFARVAARWFERAVVRSRATRRSPCPGLDVGTGLLEAAGARDFRPTAMDVSRGRAELRRARRSWSEEVRVAWIAARADSLPFSTTLARVHWRPEARREDALACARAAFALDPGRCSLRVLVVARSIDCLALAESAEDDEASGADRSSRDDAWPRSASSASCPSHVAESARRWGVRPNAAECAAEGDTFVSSPVATSCHGERGIDATESRERGCDGTSE